MLAFFLFLGLKTMENFQMRQLNAYVENDSAFKILIYRGYCSAMSCRSRLKHPFGCESPYHLLHMNSCRYSNKKFGLLLPFINLNLSADPLLSSSYFRRVVCGRPWLGRQSGENGWPFCGANLVSSVTAGKLPTRRCVQLNQPEHCVGL